MQREQNNKRCYHMFWKTDALFASKALPFNGKHKKQLWLKAYKRLQEANKKQLLAWVGSSRVRR